MSMSVWVMRSMSRFRLFPELTYKVRFNTTFARRRLKPADGDSSMTAEEHSLAWILRATLQ
ncbi:hypothetical protein Ae505Ps2_5953 [Pseudonocardia sp. Ae505_Ps2]|nr:hypothetical protein Ae505Ps2_5953 [Pseudonocardia sp. Ae505_Ps2]